MRLNNLLQATRGVQALTWETFQAGPQHTAPWTAIAYSESDLLHSLQIAEQLTVQGVEWGRGVHHSLGDAKELAAKQAYRALYRETYRMEPPQ